MNRLTLVFLRELMTTALAFLTHNFVPHVSTALLVIEEPPIVQELYISMSGFVCGCRAGKADTGGKLGRNSEMWNVACAA